MRKGGDNCGRACGSCQATSYGKKLSSRFVDAVVGETNFIVGRHLEHGRDSAVGLDGLLGFKAFQDGGARQERRCP